jgi:hypothetical protein
LKPGNSGVVGGIISMFWGCRDADASSMILIWRPWIFGERAEEGKLIN